MVSKQFACGVKFHWWFHYWFSILNEEMFNFLYVHSGQRVFVPFYISIILLGITFTSADTQESNVLFII